ncbi:Ig-like domain-containing protein [Microtetraspora sp. NBRC 16547]|uniref:Ig-like domain-containing protein n=1 Tax=Microtetraspora sp. NBRC 16547 TaxID=3030993 RepID=UPI0024A26298|nr:Ig-like domain-containing protein [Microtetraspora sp. NBRC 16547]GLX02335.1 hypothetical protein Misp02_64210 [Microtetraspora sp. NBRC 16547]
MPRTRTIGRVRKRIGVLLSVLVAAAAAGLATPRPPDAHAAAAETVITIDSHRTGDRLPVGTVRFSGTYTEAYDLRIVLNGEKMERVRLTDPDGDGSGTWNYDLDTRAHDGDFEIVVLGTSPITRYGVWSPYVLTHIDNPAAAKPSVKVVAPAEGGRVRGVTAIEVEATGRNRVATVAVRVNGGRWQPAARSGGTYTLRWDPRRLGDTMASIEARATDVRGNVGHSTTTYVAVGDGRPAPVVPHDQDRAMWLWEESSYNLVHNRGSRRALEALTKDTATYGSRPIRTVYFGVDRYWDEDMLEDLRPKVRELVAWAHAEGYKVHALIAGGTRPPFLGGLWRYRDHAVHEMEKVLNYNLSSAADERFDGVNVDIEPYIIGPMYSERSPFIQLQWLDTLQTLIDRRDASGTGIMFGPAMPVWLDGETVTWHGATKTMAQHFQDISDYVSLMDYRDTAEAIIRDAADEIAYAKQIGKPGSVIIGVETIDLVAVGGDPEWVTFAEEGRRGLETEVARVYAAYADNPAFGGIAMHHYDSILDTPSEWGPSAIFPPMPGDTTPPTAVSAPPRASTVDFQTVDVRYGRAHDDTEIHHYNVYRSTSRGFRPGPETLAGSTHGLEFTDTGLLPGTTYHYRVTAVDMKGNEGPASAVTSATTEPSSLRPVVVDELALTRDADGVAHVSLRMVDMADGTGVQAAVGGRFTKTAGQYVDMRADAGGRASADSTALGTPTGAVGFQIHRVVAPGHYWASAYDRAHAADVGW